MDDDDGNYFDEENFEEEFESEQFGVTDPERNAYERVSGRFDFEADQTLADIARKNFKLYATDEERFNAALEIYIRKFGDDFKITNDDEKQLFETIPTISKIKYKNPICYLFGYFALNNESNIDVRRLDKIRGLLNSVEDINIEDIIRYARFWINKKLGGGC